MAPGVRWPAGPRGAETTFERDAGVSPPLSPGLQGDRGAEAPGGEAYPGQLLSRPLRRPDLRAVVQGAGGASWTETM